jgi:hypothetical protein
MRAGGGVEAAAFTTGTVSGLVRPSLASPPSGTMAKRLANDAVTSLRAAVTPSIATALVTTGADLGHATKVHAVATRIIESAMV